MRERVYERNCGATWRMKSSRFCVASACGIEEGRNSPGTPQFALRRCEIHGTDSLLRFALTLALGKRPRS